MFWILKILKLNSVSIFKLWVFFKIKQVLNINMKIDIHTVCNILKILQVKIIFFTFNNSDQNSDCQQFVVKMIVCGGE